MADDIQPIPEQWYRNIDEEILFEVVSVDNDMIEIQFMDGEVKEIDMDSWDELELEAIENPQDWLGDYDDMDSDNFISGEDDDDWIGAYEERE